MGLLIDASVLIEAERGRVDVALHVGHHEQATVLCSVITASELLHGVHRAKSAGVRARREAWVEGILSAIPLLDIDLAAARAHARLWAELASRGTVIGPHDMWLAAQAVAGGHIVATANRREFERVPGLEIEIWAPG